MKIATITHLLTVFDREKSNYSRYIRENNTVAQVRKMVQGKAEGYELIGGELSELNKLLSEHIKRNGEQNTATGNFVRNLLHQYRFISV